MTHSLNLLFVTIEFEFHNFVYQWGRERRILFQIQQIISGIFLIKEINNQVFNETFSWQNFSGQYLIVRIPIDSRVGI